MPLTPEIANKVSEAFKTGVRRWAIDGRRVLVDEAQLKLTGTEDLPPAMKRLHIGVYHDGTGRVGGRLRTSVKRVSQLTDTGFEFGTNVWYGIAWERGFDRKAYTVVPKKAKALMIPLKGWAPPGKVKGKFTKKAKGLIKEAAAAGNVIFRKWAKIPAQTFPARSFLRSTIDNQAKYLQNRLRQTVTNELVKVLPQGQVFQVQVAKMK